MNTLVKAEPPEESKALAETGLTIDTVPFIYIRNPLEPSENKLVLLQAHDPNKSLSSYLGPLQGDWAVSVSGRIVDVSEYENTFIKKDDCVVVCPLVYGGGGGGGSKGILRLVAMIALTVVTGGIAAGAFAAAGGLFAAGSVSAMVLGAVVGVAGTMAINALLPPPMPKEPKSGSNFSGSPTYGIDGPKNLSTTGIPVPIAYGESWFAGNFIQSHVENIGDDQYLHLLMNLGEGEIDSLSEIKVNTQPIENFNNVEIFIRTGTENQEPIPYFDDVLVPVNRSAALNQSTYIIHSVTNPVNRLRLDMVMPTGISSMGDEGLEPATASFSIEIKKVGTSTWLPFTGGSKDISISGKQMSAVRRSYYSDVLDRTARYDVRMKHNQATDSENLSNAVSISDVNEITFDDFKYKHTALLGLRIRMNDQINGVPSIRFKLKGRKVPVFDATTGSYVNTWTSNPAWIALDALMHKRYGGGVAPQRIKMDYFRQWASHCEANSLTFNGVIDQRTNLWDALSPICKAGRAQIVRSGTRYQVAIVRKTKPVQMFSMGSIKKGSLSIDWMPADERANEVHVSYFDKDDQGKQKTVIVVSDAARERGDESKPTEITLYGVDNVTQATREGRLAMNMQQLLQTISFEVPIEAIACTLGDVVAVQHDMPNWGEGGLTEVGSTVNSLKLDKPVGMEFGGQYVVKIRHDKVVQWTADIEYLVGNVVFPGFGFNVTTFDRFRRLVSVGTGKDYAIEEAVIDQYGRHGVRVSDPAGLMVGQTIQLIDTNVIETRNVATFTGDRTTLTPTVPFSATPRAETPWSFGLMESATKLITVMSISGKDDLWKTIGGIEYSDEAYDDLVVDSKPEPINTSPPITNATFNGFQERRYLYGGLYTSDVEFTWSHNSYAYMFAEVHVSIDNEPWRFVGENSSIYTVQLSAGNLRVKIVPVTIEGFKMPFDAATVHEHTVIAGAPSAPVAPVDIRFEARKTTIEIKWGDIDAWAANKNIYRYEVWAAPGENANINDAVMLATTGNDHYPHVGLPPDTFYTYWVRAVNILANDKKSPFAPLAGLSVKTLPADTISDLFPGGIALTDLDSLLQDAIGAETSISEAIDEAKSEVDETVNEISRIISDMHAKLELVTDGNKTEVFKRKEALGALSALVSQEIATLVDADSAMAMQLTTVQAQISDEILAAIEEERVARVTADSATAIQINTLETQMGDGVAASILVESTARSTADTALAATITSLTAKTATDIAAAINTEATARTTKDDAIAATVTALTAKTTSDIAAAVNAESIARASADTAVAATVTALTAKTSSDIAAAVNSEAIARASGDTSLAATITALTARVGSSEAAITSEASTRASADAAEATARTTLTSTVNGHTASISTQTSTTDGLKAQYTVKIDTGGNVVGFGLASTNNLGTGGTVSEFSIVADRFKVVKPGQTTGIPVFIVDAALNRVVIANAIVGDLQSDNYVAGVSGWKIKK